MRRRRLLTASAAGLTWTVAGCVAVAPPSIEDRTESRTRRHPFADATVMVRIDNRSESDHDLIENARDALAYWEEHSQVYAGFEITFEVVTATEPDIIIEYVDDPSRCQSVEQYSERVLGCAPLLTDRHTVTEPVTAIVVAAERPFGKIRITTKHELGHILGLGHDDEPQEIMSHLPELRIPLYTVRIEIWERVLSAHERAGEASTVYSHGSATWNDGTYEAAVDAFGAAGAAFDEAVTKLEAARDRTDEFEGHPQVETVALDALRTHLDRLIERTSLASALSESMHDAAVAAVDGDRETANDHVSIANETIRTLNAIETPELRDIAISLGLVRGFDRDEDVIDVAADEIE